MCSRIASTPCSDDDTFGRLAANDGFDPNVAALIYVIERKIERSLDAHAFRTDARDTKDRDVPEVVVPHLSNREVQFAPEPLDDRADHPTLVLQRTAPVYPQMDLK